MKISVLASGSKGNATFIETANLKILIDLGISYNSIKNKLEDLEVDPKDIDIILITHEHIDHIGGLEKFCEKHKPLILTSNKILSKLPKYNNYISISKEPYIINSLTIESIKNSHDAIEPFGFVLTEEEHSIVYITDTGYIHQKHFPIIENKDCYVIESNHDIAMLIDGKYPFHLKQRILSDKGHLSNKQTYDYLKKLVGEKTKKIILAHLSEENNSEECVKSTFENAFDSKIELVIAKQNEATKVMEF